MDECPICINPLTETNICKTKCNHSYCLSCLLEHFTYNNTCPLCRSVIFSFKKVEDSESEEEEDETPVIVNYKMSYYQWVQIWVIQIMVTHIVIAFSPFIQVKIIRPK
jgi:hypothetical protein